MLELIPVVMVGIGPALVCALVVDYLRPAPDPRLAFLPHEHAWFTHTRARGFIEWQRCGCGAERMVK